MKINELREELAYLGMRFVTDDLHDFEEDREVKDVLYNSECAVISEVDRTVYIEFSQEYIEDTVFKHRCVIDKELYKLPLKILKQVDFLLFIASNRGLFMYDIEIVKKRSVKNEEKNNI